MSKISFIILFYLSILITCPLIIKDLLEIPKGTISLYASIRKNQTFTLRLKSNHIAGNQWRFLNPEEAITSHIHPINLNETTNSVPSKKLDNYPQKIQDDVYYDFQFMVTENAHEDFTIELVFRAKQYSSTLSTFTDTRVLYLTILNEKKMNNKK